LAYRVKGKVGKVFLMLKR